ncbi:hypothetical protein Tco_0433927, partial [Tanacetum coccineum]
MMVSSNSLYHTNPLYIVSFGSGLVNAITKRAIDEISEFSRETETSKYMKVFIMQEKVESRRFTRIQRKEAETARSSLVQVRAMVEKMEATNDHD